MGKRRFRQAKNLDRRAVKEQGAFYADLTNVIDRGDYAGLDHEDVDIDERRHAVDLGVHEERDTHAARKAVVGPARPAHCARKATADLSLDEQALCSEVASHYSANYELVLRMFKLVFGSYLRNHRALWPTKGKLKPRSVFPRLRTTGHLMAYQVVHAFDTYLDQRWLTLTGTWVTKYHVADAANCFIDRKGLEAWVALYLPLSLRGVRACEKGLPAPVIEYGHKLAGGQHVYHVHAYFVGRREKGATVLINGIRAHPEQAIGEIYVRVWLVEDLRLYDEDGERYTEVMPYVQVGWVVGALRRPRIRLSLNGAQGEHTGTDDIAMVDWRWLRYRTLIAEYAAYNGYAVRDYLAICPSCEYINAYDDAACFCLTSLGLYTNVNDGRNVRLVFPWFCSNCSQPPLISQINGNNGEWTNTDDHDAAGRGRRRREARNALHQRPVNGGRNDRDDMREREAGDPAIDEAPIDPNVQANVLAELDPAGILNQAIITANRGDMRYQQQVLQLAKRIAEWHLTQNERDDEQNRVLARAERDVLDKMRLIDHDMRHKRQLTAEEREFKREYHALDHNSKERLAAAEHETRLRLQDTDANARIQTAVISGGNQVQSSRIDADGRIEAARLQAEGNVRANVARNENPLAIALGKVLSMDENTQLAEAARVRNVMDLLEGKVDKERMFQHHYVPNIPTSFANFASQSDFDDDGFLNALPHDRRDYFIHHPDGRAYITSKHDRNAYLLSRKTNGNGTIRIPKWTFAAPHNLNGAQHVVFQDDGFTVSYWDQEENLLAPSRFYHLEGSPTVWPVKAELHPEIAEMFSVPNVHAPVLMRAVDGRTLAQKMYGFVRNAFATKNRSYHIIEMGECDNVTQFLDSMAVNRNDPNILQGYACLGMGREWFHAAAMKFQDFMTWGGYTHCRHVPVNPVFMDWYMNHYDGERDQASCIWHNHVNWKTTFAQVTSELLMITKGALTWNCVYAHAVAITQAMVIRHFVATQLSGKATEAK